MSIDAVRDSHRGSPGDEPGPHIELPTDSLHATDSPRATDSLRPADNLRTADNRPTRTLWPSEDVWRDPVEPSAALLAQWASDDAQRDARLLVALLDAEAPVPALWNTLSRLLDAGEAAPADDADRVDRIRAWARVAAFAQSMVAEEITALHGHRDSSPSLTPEDEVPYAEFLPVEVGSALRLGPRSAENLVADALTLSTRLPATLAALRAGVVDQSTARAIVEETALVEDCEVLAAVEAAALARAQTSAGTARSVRMLARRQVLRLDPASAARRAERALGDVGVDKGDLVDGVGDLCVTLTAVDRAAVWTSLNDHAAALRDVPDEDRSMSQLRAAALVDLTTKPWLFTHSRSGEATVDPTRDREGRPLRLHRCSCGGPGTCGAGANSAGAGSAGAGSAGVNSTGANSAGANSAGPNSAGPNSAGASGLRGPWRVDVVVELTTLMGLDDDPALLVGQGLIPASAARALAAEGVWRRLVTDPLTGGVLERSPTRYRPGAALIDHVTARDQHCRMPGCRKPAGGCDVDHRTAFRRGGTTTCDNLWALCRHHHRCKHSPGWSMTERDDGGSSVTTPTGHVYTAPLPTPWD